MISVQDQHRQAMELADQAFAARRSGDPIKAVALFRQAYEYERQAAEAVASDLTAEPTRSVLCRSAATLALDCREFREAERLIAIALTGDPPYEIAEELRNLLEQVHFERHLDLNGVTLDLSEFQLTMAGNAVGFGIAPSTDVVDRVRNTERLLHRTAERQRGQPFREMGPVKKSVRHDFDLFLSVPRAASFALTFRLGRSKDQLTLPGTQDTSDVINEMLSCLDHFSRSEEAELKRRIRDEAYYRNFVALARRIAPDGDGVNLVGFTVCRDGDTKRVALASPSEAVGSLDENLAERAPRRVTVIGELRRADALGNSTGQIVVVDEQGEKHKVTVPVGMMADIVKPLWEDVVEVTGTKVGRRIQLEDIKRASG